MSSPELNTAGMLNWVHDLPRGERCKEKFENILQLVRKTREINTPISILEVGTHAGVSVIEMLKRIPGSVATVIDKWELGELDKKTVDTTLEYDSAELDVRTIFYSNIHRSGMADRVTIIEGSSGQCLRELLRRGDVSFDLIYIDGSHQCLDCHADFILAWELLKEMGVMIMDDYMWNYRIQDVLAIPLHAVDHFLDNYESELWQLYTGYRMFVMKRGSGRYMENWSEPDTTEYEKGESGNLIWYCKDGEVITRDMVDRLSVFHRVHFVVNNLKQIHMLLNIGEGGFYMKEEDIIEKGEKTLIRKRE